MRVPSLVSSVLGVSLVCFACASGGAGVGTGGAGGSAGRGGAAGQGGIAGAAGRGGDGGAGGDACRGPLEDYCSRCPTYEGAFAKAFDGFEICSDDGPRTHLPAAGTCGELRWIVTWDVVDEYFEYFDPSGTMVGATFVTDVFVLCDGSSASKDYGMVPDCERVTTTRVCEPQ